MAKINFLISQFGKDKDKLCFLVRHFCFYSAAEKGHKIGTAFPWRPADMHPKGAIGSFPQAGLLLGTKSSGFILRKWIKDLYKEVYTKTASNVWMLMLGYHLQILIRNLNKLLYGWKRDFYGVVKSDIKYRIKKKKSHDGSMKMFVVYWWVRGKSSLQNTVRSHPFFKNPNTFKMHAQWNSTPWCYRWLIFFFLFTCIF